MQYAYCQAGAIQQHPKDQAHLANDKSLAAFDLIKGIARVQSARCSFPPQRRDFQTEVHQILVGDKQQAHEITAFLVFLAEG